MSLLVAAFVLLGGGADDAATARGAVEFLKGDHVCLVGNGLAERMQHDGWFETLLQARLPGRELSLRNLGFAGDELSVHQRTAGFGSMDEHLTRCRASVLLAFFGYNESFRGDAGLAAFRADLTGFVDHVRAQKYDGVSAPRLVLMSSIPHEDLHDPLLPDGREHNERLAQYHAVMAEVARELQVPFVDLFAPMRAVCAGRSKALTLDGIHLTEEGDRLLAGILVDRLCGAEPAGGKSEETAARWEPLRQAVLAKDLLWFNRYQTTDGYNVYGGRSSLAYTDGITNFEVLQRELAILDAMADHRDRRIWELAAGRDTPVDDSTLPPPIQVKTNIAGPRPDGSHEFVDATAALAQMTPAPGMQVELFADEQRFPELANPVQMAWDTRGRLWVAAWPTYPHWEPGQPMCDKLLILEDRDHDGRADVAKTFAGDLRNPTGFEFWNGGVLVANAPDLLFLKDTDGDDVADVRERLLSNLSSADTHHTANSFVIGPDGALYFQEGTFHQTQIETIWGPERNHDACVWRYEPRTRRVERHVAYDFANPHGHVFDRWGQEFVTDGTGNDNYYALPFSGRVVHPDKHASYFTFFQQRSRPCAGTEILASRHFPAENQGNLLLCNVIGFQGIFQYHISDDGSGFKAKEVEPLVFSSDPRFRPVDVEVGPDGAVYFLDWYNPIIGHMQHHLRDPNRDHVHGRVYRIRCEGRPLLEAKPLADRPLAELLELLKEPEDRVRYRARLELSARDSGAVVAAARTWAEHLDPKDPEREHHRLEALWLQEQHGTVDETLLDSLLRSPDARARAAAVRVLRFERRGAARPLARLLELADDPSPRVRLEVEVAASFFDEPLAVTTALQVLGRPTDRFLDYALQETMRTLDPVLHRALKAGELRFPDNSAGMACLVGRVSDAELELLPDTEPVLTAQLERHAISAERRRSALAELVAIRKSTPMLVLVQSMREVDGSSSDHARHVQHALGTLLLECTKDGALRGAQGAADRSALSELAGGARLPETGAFARAACILLDGALERSWHEAAASPAGLRSFLGSIEHLEPIAAPLAEAAYPLIRPLMFQSAAAPSRDPSVPSVPSVPSAASNTPATPGLWVSYYPMRMRTASRKAFEALAPALTRVVDQVGVELQGVKKSDAFALRFQGRLRIERAGEYRFALESDDGSRLYVDDDLVVDNDDDHGMREVTGSCVLDPGAHLFELCYFDQGGYEGLRLAWSGPGIPVQPIPVEFLEAALADPIRAAAIRAVAALPGHETEKSADAIRLLEEGAFAAEALDLLAALPDATWSARAAAPLIAAITRFVRGVPVQNRTRADVAAAIALGQRLAGRLPEPEAQERRHELVGLGGFTVLIRTVPHQMLYDRREFTVAAGKPVALVFQNNDLMPHNLVVTAPGQLEAVGTAAEAIALDPEAQQKSFIPDLAAVLFRIRLLLPGESTTLRFVAPEATGDYPYVCTFPGHWRVMNGVMHVVDATAEGTGLPLAESVVAPDRPDLPNGIDVPGPGAAERDFVKMWTLADFTPALAGSWEQSRSFARGRTVLSEAGCVKCHWFRGDGVRSAPDLSEVAKKYRGAELLKQILEPSAAILEGYENSVFELKTGDTVIGRIVKEDAQAWYVAPNLQEPDRLEVVARDRVESSSRSRLSAMPTGLLVTFTRDEILDLLALLQSDSRPIEKQVPDDSPPRRGGG